MNYGNSSCQMNYSAGYYPAPMMGSTTAPQPIGFPMDMHSGPSYSVPVVPIGTGQQLPTGRVEESFIENILRFNKGKIGTFYFTYQGNNKWNAMVYHGRVETAGRDHIIISDPASGKRYLLMMANLDWVEFEERINYPHMEISPAIQASLDISE
ncbi:spore coat protein GerQ [Anaerobacillus isosaccharinicus]|uniref:Spore coat protein GerQ n=1 Tax=Anaerobacillus isosaccharinicus TaxID=1532552 RepID=A0A1S2M8S6_9BACI|nr:spore coat protein GerQ [Anaerobacillus isosaccharinicus]MBA5587213.1 spore coat protein GerQ [Anaerobacillus isosaccharinicus]QOY34593.1 spore coat protein GerQ [Anaerobacillus isosaccharinicus]